MVKSIITILDKANVFLELREKIQQGKERFPFFLYCLVSYFLIGIDVSNEARNCSDLHWEH